ncbi:4-hydroxy-tetrahydrodipicolinate synthase [Candidatus Peregrinibacteria bacterium]|nr:4-hydroxy-tetrahydrodipicolinate synthase [Candidatus Peregrinibacteria bacterium]
MNTRTYAGTWTALITPFQKNGSIDEEALRKLVKRQIANGVTGIVPLGTTGESPTTNGIHEDPNVFEICEEEAHGKVLVMAGTGSNSTHEAILHTEFAKKAGADCCLVVCPYYNKPTQEGLRRHFLEVANVGLPIIVYNIKGRTGVNMSTETLMVIAEHEMIQGVKEASGDLDQIREVIKNRPDDFTVLSGDDGLTLEVMKMGGDGVISVASNIVPKEISEMVNCALSGNFEEAEKIDTYLRDMFGKLFLETNPIPVKYVVSKIGLCELQYRLPMCEPSEESQKILDTMMHSYSLI